MNTKTLNVLVFIASCEVLFNARCLNIVQREQIILIKMMRKKSSRVFCDLWCWYGSSRDLGPEYSVSFGIDTVIIDPPEYFFLCGRFYFPIKMARIDCSREWQMKYSQSYQ